MTLISTSRLSLSKNEWISWMTPSPDAEELHAFGGDHLGGSVFSAMGSPEGVPGRHEVPFGHQFALGEIDVGGITTDR
jgi:hypothetical protein